MPVQAVATLSMGVDSVSAGRKKARTEPKKSATPELVATEDDMVGRCGTVQLEREFTPRGQVQAKLRRAGHSVELVLTGHCPPGILGKTAVVKVTDAIFRTERCSMYYAKLA